MCPFKLWNVALLFESYGVFELSSIRVIELLIVLFFELSIFPLFGFSSVPLFEFLSDRIIDCSSYQMFHVSILNYLYLCKNFDIPIQQVSSNCINGTRDTRLHRTNPLTRTPSTNAWMRACTKPRANQSTWTRAPSPGNASL